MNQRCMMLVSALAGIAAAGCLKSSDKPGGDVDSATSADSRGAGSDTLSASDTMSGDGAGDASPLDLGFDTVSSGGDSVSSDAEAGESCPSPLWPPRTDGCPCMGTGNGPCTE